MLKNHEKRTYQRGELIAFKITEESGQGKFFTAYAKNISRGGFFIVSISPRELGERFHITFQIPDTDFTIRCQCEVVWMSKYHPETKIEPGYGIRFIDLPEDIAIRIDNWIVLQGL